MRLLFALSLLIVLSLGLVACSDDDDNGDEPVNGQAVPEATAPEGEPPTTESALDMPTTDGPPATDAEATVTDSGLTIIDITVGEGDDVPATASVTVHYNGWLDDGTIFDSSVQRGTPIDFPLDGVIAGWTEGIPGMKVGSVRRLIIPPELAYGDSGTGGIPPGSTLTFDVELVAFQ